MALRWISSSLMLIVLVISITKEVYFNHFLGGTIFFGRVGLPLDGKVIPYCEPSGMRWYFGSVPFPVGSCSDSSRGILLYTFFFEEGRLDVFRLDEDQWLDLHEKASADGMNIRRIDKEARYIEVGKEIILRVAFRQGLDGICYYPHGGFEICGIGFDPLSKFSVAEVE